MELENQVCSLEIAEKLKEIGVKQESLWCWCKFLEGWIVVRNIQPPYDWEYQGVTYSAFTVAELGEIFKIAGQAMRLPWYNKKHEKWWVFRKGREIMADTEANARGKMLIYLIENKFMGQKKEKIDVNHHGWINKA